MAEIEPKGLFPRGKFLFILQKYLSSVVFYKCEQDFLSYQNFVKPTKLQRHHRPASEQDKFLSRVKGVRFYNLEAFI